MRLLFDQNISYRILSHLPAKIKASHVKREGLLNSTDYEIREFAKNNDYTIVTQDSVFNDIYLLKGLPPKIIWIQTGNMKTSDLYQIFQNQYDHISLFIKDPDQGCLEIFRQDI